MIDSEKNLINLTGEEIYKIWLDAEHPLFKYLGDNNGCVSIIAHLGQHSSIGEPLDSRIRADKANILPPFEEMVTAWDAMDIDARRVALERFQYWQEEYKMQPKWIDSLLNEELTKENASLSKHNKELLEEVVKLRDEAVYLEAGNRNQENWINKLLEGAREHCASDGSYMADNVLYERFGLYGRRACSSTDQKCIHMLNETIVLKDEHIKDISDQIKKLEYRRDSAILDLEAHGEVQFKRILELEEKIEGQSANTERLKDLLVQRYADIDRLNANLRVLNKGIQQLAAEALE